MSPLRVSIRGASTYLPHGHPPRRLTRFAHGAERYADAVGEKISLWRDFDDAAVLLQLLGAFEVLQERVGDVGRDVGTIQDSRRAGEGDSGGRDLDPGAEGDSLAMGTVIETLGLARR